MHFYYALSNLLIYSFVNNVSTDKEDVMEIKYVVKNNDSVSHHVGTRIMLDTMLGNNDDAPFRVQGTGSVTTETEFTGDDIPQYWQAFDSLTEPTVVSQGTFVRQCRQLKVVIPNAVRNLNRILHRFRSSE